MGFVRFLLLILASPLILLARLLGFGRPPIAYLPDDHPEMAAAIAKAQRTLPEFRRWLAAPEPGMADFGIKARFKTAHGGEHCWVGELQSNGSGFVGQLTVHPQAVPGLQLGSRVEISDDMITDWSYSQNGVFRGHYTTKVLVPRMSRRLREQVLAVYGWSAAEFAQARS